MKLLAGLLLMIGNGLWLFGQGPDPPNPDYPDDDPDPPETMTLSLPGLTGSSVNYLAYAPKEGGDFEVENLGGLPASFLFVAFAPDGRRTQQVFELESDEIKMFVTSEYAWAESILISSLQPFALSTAYPVEIAGSRDRSMPVIEPKLPLWVIEIVLPNGELRTVGIDEQNRVHWPVYIPRRSFGVWSFEKESVIREDGAFLPRMR